MKYQIEPAEDTDDFEAEAEAVRNSINFQSFLDGRMKCRVRCPIEDIEKQIKEELMAESETLHESFGK
jgi:hypothetical protein